MEVRDRVFIIMQLEMTCTDHFCNTETLKFAINLRTSNMNAENSTSICSILVVLVIEA